MNENPLRMQFVTTPSNNVLFSACKAVEENEDEALPALRGFDLREGYRLISRLFQSVLREHVPASTFSRAEKQARVASQRLSKELQSEAKKAEGTRKKNDQPTLFEWKNSK